jgi:predicted ATPase
VMAERQETEQGIIQIQRGLTDHQATGGALRRPYWLGLLVEAHCEAENVAEALPILADALSVVEKTEERWFEAELHRLKGELLLKQNPSDTVEATRCFQNAISVARAHGTKAWELRATMGLARLLRDTNRRDEARAILAEIYGWFTGFDTRDLKDAKALLNELEGTRT